MAILVLSVWLIPSPITFTQTSNRMIVTIVSASNSGNDFNMDNDAYRDKLMKLFSYRSYVQKEVKKLDMKVGETQSLDLMEGYTLELTLIQEESNKITANAVIKKEQKDYINTELSIEKPGVFFMGGPTLSSGDLILILESGY